MTVTPFVPDPAAGARVLEEDLAYVFHSWAAQAGRTPLCIAGGEGSYVWDYDGNRYLDLSSQLVNTNIGHRHPAVVAAIQEQAGHLATVAPQHANDMRGRAARMIVEIAGEPFAKVFFTNGGAEANENAVRMARLHTRRPKIITTYRSYHGSTTTAINMTGDPRRWPNDTGSAGVVHVFGPYLYRSAFHAATEAEESERALQHLAQTIQMEGPATIAAVVLETVPGTAGVLVPPPGYLTGVRELCDRHGILLVVDEVMVGFGRLGAWFGVQHFGVRPDLITFAKGVNSGYVPLGGVIISAEVASTFDAMPYPGGLTYSGHPLACASAVASMTAMRAEGIVQHAAQIGRDVLGPGLREIAMRHPSVGEVRGLGVMWALELVRDPRTREPLVPYAAGGAANAPIAELARACQDRGVLPLTAGNRLHVVPPCTITEAEVKDGLAVLDDALAVTDAYAASS